MPHSTNSSRRSDRLLDTTPFAARLDRTNQPCAWRRRSPQRLRKSWIRRLMPDRDPRRRGLTRSASGPSPLRSSMEGGADDGSPLGHERGARLRPTREGDSSSYDAWCDIAPRSLAPTRGLEKVCSRPIVGAVLRHGRERNLRPRSTRQQCHGTTDSPAKAPVRWSRRHFRHPQAP